MKKILISLFSCALIFTVGCTNQMNKQYGSTQVSIPTIQSVAIADLDVGKKIRGTSSSGYLFNLIQVKGEKEFADGVYFTAYSRDAANAAISFGDGSLTRLKKAAAYKALQNSGYDYIVNPRYTVKINKNLIYKEMSCTVDGMGANIKNIRNVKEEYYYKKD